MNLRILFVAIGLALLILLGSIAAQATTVTALTECPSAAVEPYCIVVPGVQRGEEIETTTRYVLSNETTGTITITQAIYSDTLLVKPVIQLTPGQVQNFYVEWPRIPRPFSGTMVLTGTGAFSAQLIGPTIACGSQNPHQCLTVYLTAAARFYTINNATGQPLTFEHQVYESGELVRTFTDTIPLFSFERYDILDDQVRLASDLDSPHVVQVQLPLPPPSPPIRTTYLPAILR